jgi:hypothetical protein
MKVKREKVRYKGVFNFPHKVKIIYKHAYSQTQALSIMCREIAQEDNLSYFQVYNYFREANRTIERE